MSDFLLLPCAKELINLDHVVVIYMEPQAEPTAEYELQVIFSGDEKPISYSYEDSLVILEAMAKKMVLSEQDLVLRLRQNAEEFGGDPFGTDKDPYA